MTGTSVLSPRKDSQMRVRIICYEDINAWILGKFARKLKEELTDLGVNAEIGGSSDPSADINHHIIYLGLDASMTTAKDTLMITHVDDIRKLNQLKRQLQTAAAGICMSRPLMDELIAAGLPADKLCFINPAHDGMVGIKPYVIGITSQVKADGCKREHLVVDLSSHISPEYFTFKIMGSGWEPVIKVLRNRGFEVIYYPDFDYEGYVKMIPTFDYYFYMGQDEGSMGFIDALAAGVKTIVTPQGFHLDAENGITHPFNTLEELVSVFTALADERKKLVESVAHWTWKDYATKHLQIWRHIIDPQTHPVITYKDGLKSLLKKDQPAFVAQGNFRYRLRLYQGAIKRTGFKLRNALKDYDTFKRKSTDFIRKLWT